MLSKFLDLFTINRRVSALESTVVLLSRQAERFKRQMHELAAAIEEMVKAINIHNADDLAYQGQVNARLAALQSRIDALPTLPVTGQDELQQAVNDLRAAVNAQPVLVLPDLPSGNLSVQPVTPAPSAPTVPPPAPVEPIAPAPVVPGPPTASDTAGSDLTPPAATSTPAPSDVSSNVATTATQAETAPSPSEPVTSQQAAEIDRQNQGFPEDV